MPGSQFCLELWRAKVGYPSASVTHQGHEATAQSLVGIGYRRALPGGAALPQLPAVITSFRKLSFLTDTLM